MFSNLPSHAIRDCHSSGFSGRVAKLKPNTGELYFERPLASLLVI
jgi:hypothetical protein